MADTIDVDKRKPAPNPVRRLHTLLSTALRDPSTHVLAGFGKALGHPEPYDYERVQQGLLDLVPAFARAERWVAALPSDDGEEKYEVEYQRLMRDVPTTVVRAPLIMRISELAKRFPDGDPKEVLQFLNLCARAQMPAPNSEKLATEEELERIREAAKDLLEAVEEATSVDEELRRIGRRAADDLLRAAAEYRVHGAEALKDGFGPALIDVETYGRRKLRGEVLPSAKALLKKILGALWVAHFLYVNVEPYATPLLPSGRSIISIVFDAGKAGIEAGWKQLEEGHQPALEPAVDAEICAKPEDGASTQQMNVDDLEDEATKCLVPALQLGFEAAHCGSLLCHATAEQIPARESVLDLPNSLKVCATLLMRIVDDVRCVAIIASKGYPAQALSLGASTFEHTYNLAYIGSIEARADQWLAHRKLKRMPVRSIERVVQCIVGATLGLGDEVDPKSLPEDVATNLKAKVDEVMDPYMQFCLPKHGNPIYQKGQNWAVDDESFRLTCGPNISEASVQNAMWALDQVGRLAALACEFFVHHHRSSLVLDESKTSAIVAQLDERRTKLRVHARAKGWHRDPFKRLRD